MIIDCIADLHGHYPKLEGGDLLIVAGDLTARDNVNDFLEFVYWTRNQEYEEIIVIGGNHDNYIQNHIHIEDLEDAGEFIYLCDSGNEFEYEEQIDHPASNEHMSIDVLMYQKKKIKIWGSPWTLKFSGMNPNCMAFTCDTEEELADKWAMIPDDTDILVTHSPPYGILDEVEIYGHERDECNEAQLDATMHVGSKSLALKIGKMETPPKLWIWGHIHESYGEDLVVRGKPCKMINASHVNERYEPVNKPVRVIL